MGYFSFFSTILLVFPLVSGLPSSEFIHPNFTVSEYQVIDNQGAFLSSRNGTFMAAITSPVPQKTNFYLCVIHVASSAIIWSANRDAPISASGTVSLTSSGITIADQNGNRRWSTPAFQSLVYGLLLTEMGNLILLDKSNGSLWESFQHPTDTIVIGQQLPVGAYLSSAVSEMDLSSGDYRLTISTSDALLQWYQQTYWKLSMNTQAFTNSNYAVEYMVINRTGLYLLAHNGSTVVIQVFFEPADFRIAKLGISGKFHVKRYSRSNWVEELWGPDDDCKLPFICGQVGLCTGNTGSSNPICSCPLGFRAGSQNMTGCVPSDDSYSLPFACNTTNNDSRLNSSQVSYLWLGKGTEYFSTSFSDPLKYGVNLSVCEDLCSRDCSCLGIFYGNSSGSCYALENKLGSIISSSDGGIGLQGYVKTLAVRVSTTNSNGTNSSSNARQKVPVAAVVLLPFTGFFLLVVLGFLWWRRWGLSMSSDIKLHRSNSHTSEDLDFFCIPGLPKRFYYEELDAATDHFTTQVGSGGFGAVYKGTLPDKTVVAIKKLTNLGVQGRKDFCTEIAIIGNIHHVNLVRLKGFCAQDRQRLLVYEYMNLGSLDRTLFGSGAVLEWQERFDIALGTARGLAYLHSGCQHKIIHCDVKPENILLDDHLQAKISDFGLSKLLSQEQSGLFTTMRGTRGYLAPEWLTNSSISEKTDVYSFGMVLLELVSGRKNCSPRSQSHNDDSSNSNGGHSSSSSGSALVYFPLLALEMHEEGKYLELADPRLQGRVRREEVEKLVRIALCCLHEDPVLRPTMVSVVGMLEGGIPLVHPVMESLNFLRFYGRRFTEASTIMEPNRSMLYPLANASSSTASGIGTGFSYISSQQISGPR